MIHGLFPGADTLALRSKAVTRSISAENMTGEKGKGGMDPAGENSAARDLGVGWKTKPCLSIPAGETQVLADIQGPGSIQSIWMTGSVGRHFILRFYWDGQETPSVECPLPDFFASGWMSNMGNTTFFGPKIPFAPIQSAMVAVNPCRGMNCFWPMPFRKRARITVENRHPEARTLFFQINYALGDVPDDALYFHAQYRQARPLTAKEDFVILNGVQGQGHYVGTALSVGLNGSGGWWGEGEVKFFLDGDRDFPTICGTGTEDYFGGAYNWDVDGVYTPYTGPYLGMHQVIQPDGLYEANMRFSMYRWHVMDPIRFERDLKVTIQDLGWMSGGRYLPRRDDMMSVAYWYQGLPAAAFPVLPSQDELEIQ